MILVYHGENIVASRNQWHQQIQKAKAKGVGEILYLDGKKVNLTDLIQACQAQSLFGAERVVGIENLLARPRSKQKSELMEFLAETVKIEGSPDIYMWESRAATPAQLKALGSRVKIEEFKLTKSLFVFLDALKPGNTKQLMELLAQALQQEAAELVFFMLVRQVRYLLQVKTGANLKLAPWQKSKLSAQAQKFEVNRLLQIYQDLLKIDYQNKTGGSLISLAENLDIVIAKI